MVFHGHIVQTYQIVGYAQVGYAFILQVRHIVILDTLVPGKGM